MITNLNLKEQTKLILSFNGITTIERLKKLTLHEVKQIKGLGRKGINDIINAFSKCGGYKQKND